MNKSNIVLGFAFGDEGKGTVVQHLCRTAVGERKKALVVCFSGGPQNAHTVKVGDLVHVCSSFGSGSLLGVPVYHTEQYYVDPLCFLKEREVLKEKIGPRYHCLINMFSPECRVVTYFDVMANQEDSKNIEDGTCGKGIFKTFTRHKDIPFTVGDIFTKTDEELEELLASISRYWFPDADVSAEMISEYVCALREFEMYVYRSFTLSGLSIDDSFDTVASKFDVLIFEGSQGLLLDMEHGLKPPHLTPSKVGLNALEERYSKYIEDADVFLTTRTYVTRHGNGFTPVGHACDNYEELIHYRFRDPNETNVYNDWQKSFKVGVFEPALLNFAYKYHNLERYRDEYSCRFILTVSHTDAYEGSDRFYYSVDHETVDSVYIENSEDSAKAVADLCGFSVDGIIWSGTAHGRYEEYPLTK